MSYTFNNRKVEVIDLEHELSEHMVWAIAARWEDTGIELTEAELDAFNETCYSDLYQDAYEDAAASAYDYYKSRDD